MPDVEAARLTDPVEHSSALAGLLVGLAAGAAIGVFIVATGGLGAGVVAAAVVGGAAATGAGVGEVLGSLSVAPGITTGAIASGSTNVITNNLLAARATADFVACAGTPPVNIPVHQGKKIAQGSATVFINDCHAARKTDKIQCSAKIQDGSHNVIIGGETVTTMPLEAEVPWVWHAAIAALGLVSAVILAGPVVAALGFAGSIAGGAGATWIAQQMGLGEDAQKIAGLIGSFAGGALGMKGGGALLEVSPRLAALDRGIMDTTLRALPESVRTDLASTRGTTPMQTAAREMIRSGQTPGSPAALAAGWQGKGAYPGVDPLVNRPAVPGERLYGALNAKGEPTGFYMSERQYNEFRANGGTREDYSQGLQIAPGNKPKYLTPDNPFGYRNNISVFEVRNPITVAEGPTVANPQFGRGGLDQVYSEGFANGDIVPVMENGAPATVTLNPSTSLPAYNPAQAPSAAWSPFLGSQGAGSTAPLTQPGG